MIAMEIAVAAPPELHVHRVAELARGLSLMMNHQGARLAPDLPAGHAHAAAPVNLFHVHEVAFVQKPNGAERGTADQHACAERMVDRKGHLPRWIAAIEARVHYTVIHREQVEQRL